jgi:CO/xanthine dehydrogenase FAD-binding subunit
MDLRYEAPDTLQAAVALLAKESGPARVLAGGTDVIVQMETDLIEPALLVDIKKIP